MPPAVRFTSIYSRHDGIVDWRFATAPNGDSYEVDGLHTDLVVNVEVYRILSNVLAGYPREIVKLRSMSAAASDIKNGKNPAAQTPLGASPPARLNPTYTRKRPLAQRRDNSRNSSMPYIRNGG